jgi:hypothetical protein
MLEFLIQFWVHALAIQLIKILFGVHANARNTVRAPRACYKIGKNDVWGPHEC